MSLLFYALFVGGIVAADQFTKYLTVANIALYEDIPFIPGLLQLTYVQNTGAGSTVWSAWRAWCSRTPCWPGFGSSGAALM